MPLRLVAAYTLLTLLAAIGLFGIWYWMVRDPIARQIRRQRRARRSAASLPPTANGNQPAFEAD